jgi:hypothetical protein
MVCNVGATSGYCPPYGSCGSGAVYEWCCTNSYRHQCAENISTHRYSWQADQSLPCNTPCSESTCPLPNKCMAGECRKVTQTCTSFNCVTPYICSSGDCILDPSIPLCSEENCPPPNLCVGGSCTNPSPGCTAANCASPSTCVDGVCAFPDLCSEENCQYPNSCVGGYCIEPDIPLDEPVSVTCAVNTCVPPNYCYDDLCITDVSSDVVFTSSTIVSSTTANNNIYIYGAIGVLAVILLTR